MADHIDNRFNKIDRELAEISKAIISLARMEERMVSLFQRQDVYDLRQQAMGERIGAMFDRIVELEKASMSTRTLERIFYIVISAGAASLFWYMQQ